jgi:hypothetical protein
MRPAGAGAVRVTYGAPWWHPEASPLRDVHAFMRAAGQEAYPAAGRDEAADEAADHRVPIGALEEDVVESESTPGTYYHMRRRADGTWWCECPGFTYREDCKHVQRKREGL